MNLIESGVGDRVKMVRRGGGRRRRKRTKGGGQKKKEEEAEREEAGRETQKGRIKAAETLEEMIEEYRYVHFNGESPSYLTMHCDCRGILLVQTSPGTMLS